MHSNGFCIKSIVFPHFGPAWPAGRPDFFFEKPRPAPPARILSLFLHATEPQERCR